MFVKKTVRLSCVTRARQHPPRSKSRFGVQSDRTHKLARGNMLNRVTIVKNNSLFENMHSYVGRNIADDLRIQMLVRDLVV